MASLPALPTPFIARELPISRLGLATRLKLLHESDAELLDRIEAVMLWERINVVMNEPDIVREVEELVSRLDSENLRDVVRDRFELRTVLAAMRRRRRGEPAPPPKTSWGYGRYVDHIRRNWTRPHFGLRRAMPWLAGLREFHDAGDTLEMDRVIARLAWRQLVTGLGFHEFDFDAVVLYVLRYDMIARWLGWSGADARKRFDRLVAAGLSEHVGLVPKPS